MKSLSEKDLFRIFVILDKAAAAQTSKKKAKLALCEICDNVKAALNINVLLNEQIMVIDNALRRYRKIKEKEFKKHGYTYIIETASDDMLVINPLMEEKDEKGPSLSKKKRTAGDEKPAHRPRSSLVELGDRRQKERTSEIVSVIEKYRENVFPELTFNQLLGYLLYRENRQGNKIVSDVGNKLFNQTFNVMSDAFTDDEAVAFKHNLTLSREQIRKTRYVLQGKNVYFPTSNELNEARKKLRPIVSTTLGNKGVKVDYSELVKMTTESVLEIISDEGRFEIKEDDKYKMYFKDGCDGAGQQTTMKSKDMVNSKHHMFQYGLVPLKMVCSRESEEEITTMWLNESPNSQLSVRPVYLIREEETNKELIDEVITTTDKARDKLNEEGMVVTFNGLKVNMCFDIKDSMKDLKLKRNISGMKGARCILCETKQKDWTNSEKVNNGFHITRTAAEAKQIYQTLADEDGNVKRVAGDFESRKGVTAEPITTSDQRSVCITHGYINGVNWFLKLLYRCYTDYRCWVEHADPRGHPIRKAKEDVLDILEDRHGLYLDQCAGACEMTGTSTTGGQGRRFFSEEVLPTLREIVPLKYNENLLILHKQLSIILRVVSSTGQVDVDAYEQLCLDFSLNVIDNFPFALLNDTLHATVHHSAELIKLNEGYSLGALSEEGLEGNNKDIRNYLSKFCRKTNKVHQLTDVIFRLLERSDPGILKLIRFQQSQKKCTECGSKEHTIRSHGRKYSLPKGDYDSAVNDILM